MTKLTTGISSTFSNRARLRSGNLAVQRWHLQSQRADPHWHALQLLAFCWRQQTAFRITRMQ